MRVYDEIFIADEYDLDASFRERFKDRLVLGSRGYGYWAWKPQIILQVLKACHSGDIVHYADIGCHLNPAGRDRLLEYFEAADQSASGILAFSYEAPKPPFPYDGRALFDWPNRHWVKGDLLDHLAVRTRAEIVDSQTIAGGTFFIKKNSPSIALLQEWLSVIEHDFHLIDDAPSISPNLPGFIEHRHDQAIFLSFAEFTVFPACLPTNTFIRRCGQRPRLGSACKFSDTCSTRYGYRSAESTPLPVVEFGGRVRGTSTRSRMKIRGSYRGATDAPNSKVGSGASCATSFSLMRATISPEHPCRQHSSLVL
ncbi:MAG: hypothetical protein IPM02_22355 [Betaproteobacteria bacterium]|nr:hypothetical protein [Betaproteobacteria bacterium]